MKIDARKTTAHLRKGLFMAGDGKLIRGGSSAVQLAEFSRNHFEVVVPRHVHRFSPVLELQHLVTAKTRKAYFCVIEWIFLARKNFSET